MLSFVVRCLIVVLLVAGVSAVSGAIAAPPAAAQTIADSDGDGLSDADASDRCPHLAGSQSPFVGCPTEDPDGDGFSSRPFVPGGLPGDLCGEIAGTLEFLGCPSSDPDGDGVAEDSCSQVAAPPPSGCPILAPPEPGPLRVEGRRMELDRRGALSLYGGPFGGDLPVPFSPGTLTVWLPNGMSILDGSVDPCSKRQVRTAGNRLRCDKVAGGRLATGTATTGWQAFAGPKRGGKRLVWMRTKTDDGSPHVVGTGVVQKAAGAFRTKVVLRFGELELSTRGIEVEIFQLDEKRRCPAGGWRFRAEVAVAGDSDRVSWREPCGRS